MIRGVVTRCHNCTLLQKDKHKIVSRCHYCTALLQRINTCTQAPTTPTPTHTPPPLPPLTMYCTTRGKDKKLFPLGESVYIHDIHIRCEVLKVYSLTLFLSRSIREQKCRLQIIKYLPPYSTLQSWNLRYREVK